MSIRRSYQQFRQRVCVIALARSAKAFRLLANMKEGQMELANKANLAVVCVAFVFVAAIVIGWIG